MQRDNQIHVADRLWSHSHAIFVPKGRTRSLLRFNLRERLVSEPVSTQFLSFTTNAVMK